MNQSAYETLDCTLQSTHGDALSKKIDITLTTKWKKIKGIGVENKNWCKIVCASEILKCRFLVSRYFCICRVMTPDCLVHFVQTCKNIEKKL